MILDALLPPLFGIAGLVVAFVIYTIMVRQSEGDEKIRKIGDAIHEGAMVFMNTEYSRLAMFAIPLGIILYFALGINTAISFAVGALASGLAGYLGMFSATKANVRTTTAAQSEGQAGALTIAFTAAQLWASASLRWASWVSASYTGSLGATPKQRMPSTDLAWAHQASRSSHALVEASTPSVLTWRDLVGKVEAGIPEMIPETLV